jgi:hypothetical protein
VISCGGVVLERLAGGSVSILAMASRMCRSRSATGARALRTPRPGRPRCLPEAWQGVLADHHVGVAAEKVAKLDAYPRQIEQREFRGRRTLQHVDIAPSGLLPPQILPARPAGALSCRRAHGFPPSHIALHRALRLTTRFRRRMCRISDGVSDMWRMACRHRNGARQGSPMAANRVQFLVAEGTGRKGEPRARATYRTNPKPAGILTFFGVFGVCRRETAGRGRRSPTCRDCHAAPGNGPALVHDTEA